MQRARSRNHSPRALPLCLLTHWMLLCSLQTIQILSPWLTPTSKCANRSWQTAICNMMELSRGAGLKCTVTTEAMKVGRPCRDRDIEDQTKWWEGARWEGWKNRLSKGTLEKLGDDQYVWSKMNMGWRGVNLGSYLLFGIFNHLELSSSSLRFLDYSTPHAQWAKALGCQPWPGSSVG